MLELINVEMMYNRVILVLKGITMQVPEGGMVALMGANGAGKTTILKCISGLEHAEQGEVTDGGDPLPRPKDRAQRPHGNCPSGDRAAFPVRCPDAVCICQYPQPLQIMYGAPLLYH